MIVDGSPQLRKGVIEYCILALVAREPMYGWDLARQLGQVDLVSSIGTLYPVLTRLRERGSIIMTEYQLAGGPARKYYAPTASGLRELEQFRTEWDKFTRQVSALLDEGVIQ